MNTIELPNVMSSICSSDVQWPEMQSPETESDMKKQHDKITSLEMRVRELEESLAASEKENATLRLRLKIEASPQTASRIEKDMDSEIHTNAQDHPLRQGSQGANETVNSSRGVNGEIIFSHRDKKQFDSNIPDMQMIQGTLKENEKSNILSPDEVKEIWFNTSKPNTGSSLKKDMDYTPDSAFSPVEPSPFQIPGMEFDEPPKKSQIRGKRKPDWTIEVPEIVDVKESDEDSD